MTPPKAVLVDVDGTLVDTVDPHARAWVETLRRYGIEADLGDIRLQIGKGATSSCPASPPGHAGGAGR